MRTHSRHLRLGQGLVLAASLVASSTAAAQNATEAPKLAINRFHPAPAGDRMFGVQSPDVAGHLALRASALFDYAHNPVVLRDKNGENAGAIVGGQLFFHLGASLSLRDRFAVNLNIPMALAQSGDSPTIDGRTFSSPSGFAFGDLRFGARVRLLGDYDDAVQLGLGGFVWLPTGSGDFVTDGSIRGMPQILVGGRVGRSVYSTAFGLELRGAQSYFDSITQGSMFNAGLGYAYVLGASEKVQVGAELSFATVISDPASHNTNAELLLSGRYRFAKSLEAGLGFGPGMSSGVGTPQVRVIGMLSYAPPVEKPVDSDRDGIFDKDDACKLEPGPQNPDLKRNGCPLDRDNDGIVDPKDACIDIPGVVQPEPGRNGCPPDMDRDGIIDPVDACINVFGLPNPIPTKHGCPPDMDNDGIFDPQDACVNVFGMPNQNPARNGCPPDQDGDGVLDPQDACVDVSGVAHADPKKNGCPPDMDNDGIVDAQDACRDIPGIKTADPATNGCPGDTDGDSIRDDKDACPHEKGPTDADPKQNGCPKSVRVTESEVVILQQVQFDLGTTTIKKTSDPLLDEVAGALKDHPEFVKIEIQGHTDDRGGKKLNERLSEERAKAVMQALIKRGLEADRLTAKGYGQDKPIGDNKTTDGRAKNRRVQFVILEKRKKAQRR